MTIREFYLNEEIPRRKERINRLIELGAPTVIVEKDQKILNDRLAGKISMGGDKSLLDREYIKHADFFTPRAKNITHTIFNNGEIIVKYENYRGHISRKIMEYKKENNFV